MMSRQALNTCQNHEISGYQKAPPTCRFIRNQLVVEITSSAQLAHLFGWALKKHTILAFFLYTAGTVSHELPVHNGHSHTLGALPRRRG